MRRYRFLPYLAAFAAFFIAAQSHAQVKPAQAPSTLTPGSAAWSPQIHEGQGGGFADVTGVGCPHQLVWLDQNYFGCPDWVQLYSLDPSEHTTVTLGNVGGQHPAAGDVIGIDWVVWASGGGSSTTYHLTYTIQAGDIGADDGATYLNAIVGLGNCINGGTSFCGGNAGFYNALKTYKAFSFESGNTGTIAYQSSVAGQSARLTTTTARTIFDQPWTPGGAQNCGGTTGGCNITGVGNAHTTVTIAVDGADGGPTLVLKRYPGHFPYAGDRGGQFEILGGSGNTSYGNQLFAIATTYTGTHGAGGTADTASVKLNAQYQGAVITPMTLSPGVQIGAPTGGDQGAGTLNIQGNVYDNGTAPTGTSGYVRSTSPTLVTPILGVASATTVNKVTITAPATGSTLTIADGKTLTDTSGTGAVALKGATTGGFAQAAVADLSDGSTVTTTAESHVQTTDVSSSDSTTPIEFADFAQTLLAGGKYSCQGFIHFTTAPTTSNGAKISLTGTGGLSMTTISVTSVPYNGSALAGAVGTVTSLGSAFFNQKVAVTDIFVSAALRVNAGGVLHMNLFENTTSGTITSTAGNARWDCHHAA